MEKSSQPPPYDQHEPLPAHGHHPPLPPHGHHPPAGTVIIGQPISGQAIYMGMNFGPASQNATCPHCHSQILTRVQAESSTKTHLYALLLCLLFCPCVCLPYCIDSCKNKNHYCPNCGAYLGTHNN